jgi:hypothetical protein
VGALPEHSWSRRGANKLLRMSPVPPV